MSETRLDRLMPALSARERVVLVLRAYKARTPEDPAIRLTMPPAQVGEFNRLLAVANAINVELSLTLQLIRAQIRQTEIKVGWLQSLFCGALEFQALGSYIHAHTKEPITESGLAERAVELGAERARLPELIEVLVEECTTWSKKDRDADGKITDAARDRAWDEQERRLRDAIKSGALGAKGRGRQATVAWGGFAAWAGIGQAVFPDWGWEYKVYSDDEKEKVDRLQRERRFVERIVTETPEHLRLPKVEGGPMTFEANPASKQQSLILALLGVIPAEVNCHWVELRAIEVAIEELAEEFDGEDPLDAISRDLLAECRTAVDEACEAVERLGTEIVLDEPMADDVATVHKLVRNAAER